MGSNPVKVPKFFSALIFAIAKSDDDTLHLKSRDKIGIVLPSGRKNVLRKLLRIPYRRLKAGFSVC